ncbi:retrotransposon hot spot (RHS) protein [Trypanosoma conorhini]|uniref:Retrotransposon hot spot (RHS) protein n=1 Tax=Trypanosoma conorhini TaxID=83891 RepID=A0A3R7RDX2_9TRYP|nr:retrotransposon hot spot (RHS) protein [Trypanosoma conorhini]RNF00661.1 retrotransposon hot spot (RHS) protein [Trypanosoma conorhini]
MSGRSEETYAAAESPATNVPRGQPRARSGPSGGSAQPAALRIRQEGAQQRPRWTLISTVEDVLLFGGEGPIGEIKLNDFLRRELGGRGVVEANENVSLESCVAQPETFIANENDLCLILASPSYTAIKEAIEDARRLVEHEVETLQRWREFAQKNIVSPVGRAKLDAALDAAVEEEARQRRERLEKLPWEERVYRSVHEAKWGYVESGHATEPLGMKVVGANSSEPEKMWSAGEVNVIPRPEEGDEIEEARGARLELLVLTSESGWPYGDFARDFKDVFVRKEVLRVWNVLKEDIDGWPTRDEEMFGKRAYVVVGTPSVGKSLAVGSFVLRQLLHYDAAKVAVVAYFVDGCVYFFHKTGHNAGTVVEYTSTEQGVWAMDSLAGRHVPGYFIFDMAKNHQLGGHMSPGRWGGVVLSLPDIKYYDWLCDKHGAGTIFVNSYTARELKALFAWRERKSLRDLHGGEERRKTALEESWRAVQQRIDEVGPLPRYVFDAKASRERWAVVVAALSSNSDVDMNYYAGLLFGRANWHEDGTTDKLTKQVRVLWEGTYVRERFEFLPVSLEVERELRRMVITENLQMSRLLSALGTCSINAAADLERWGCLVFLVGGVVEAVARKMTYLPRTAEGEPRPSVLADGHAAGRFPSRPRLFEYTTGGAREAEIQQVELEPGVLFLPDTRRFPVLDAFYVAGVQPRAPPAGRRRARDTPTGEQSSAGKTMTLVGLQVRKQDAHHTTASEMASFMEYMRSNFNNWEVLKEAMAWEIIYIRHAASTLMTTRQQCTFTGQRSLDPQAPENFWERKVEQYQVQLDAEIADKLAGCRR